MITEKDLKEIQEQLMEIAGRLNIVTEKVKAEFMIGDEILHKKTGVYTDVLDVIQFKNQIRYNIEIKKKDMWVAPSELEAA